MKVLFLLSFLFLFPACSQKSQTQKSQDALSSMFDAYWDERSKFFPLEATQQGDNRYNHLLPNDQTKEFRDNLEKFFQDYLTRLQKFDRNALNDNDRVSYDIFKYEMEMQLEGLKQPLW